MHACTTWCVHACITCTTRPNTAPPPPQDTVAVQELRFGDNDTLSAQVSLGGAGRVVCVGGRESPAKGEGRVGPALSPSTHSLHEGRHYHQALHKVGGRKMLP